VKSFDIVCFFLIAIVNFNQITRHEELSTTFYGIFNEENGDEEHTDRQE